MLDALKLESEKLVRSWMQHEPGKLRDYLVAGVEDPRINLQSVLSRHFILRSLFAEKFRPLMDCECLFAAIMNWLIAMAANSDAQDLEAIHNALQRDADNAEGLEIPRFILKAFRNLPLACGSFEIPNYIQSYLGQTEGNGAAHDNECLNTFQHLWSELLAAEDAPQGKAIGVLEPACGSANDYRFLHSFGIARFLNYTGIDLCSKNIENARAIFPEVQFDVGNIFEIDAQDGAFEIAFVHDLFEHLSVDGLHAAVKELCRVTQRAICANFFQMDEIPDHVIRPMDDYYWNLLSMDQTKKLFSALGFNSHIIRIKSFLRQEFGCEYTHNPSAYTLILRRT